MKRDKIALGIVLAFIVGGSILAVSSYGTEVEAEAPEPKEPELTVVEKRVQLIQQSREFQQEQRLRATARAYFELSNETQAVAVNYSEKALATYKLANELENAWKIKQQEK